MTILLDSSIKNKQAVGACARLKFSEHFDRYHETGDAKSLMIIFDHNRTSVPIILAQHVSLKFVHTTVGYFMS